MRNLLLLIVAFVSVQSFAVVVSGEKAEEVSASLVKAGARVKELHGTFQSVSVSGLVCIQNSAFVLLPFKCQFIEDGRLVEVGMNKISSTLATALIDAGAQVQSERTGSLLKTTVTAKSVDCRRTTVQKVTLCSVK